MRPSFVRFAAGCLGGVALLLLGTRAEATVVLPQDVTALSRNADWILRGVVRNQYSDWDPGRRRIYTFTEIEVQETWHHRDGEPQAGLVVRTLGGQVGDIGMNVAGSSQFSPGEEVLLFVRKSERVQGSFHVVGLSQGKFRIVPGQDGTLRAVPDAAGLAYARRGPGATELDHDGSHLQAMPLMAMRAAVREALLSADPAVRETRPALQLPGTESQPRLDSAP